MKNKIKEQGFAPAVKKVLSLMLALTMLFSITAMVDLSALAADNTNEKKICEQMMKALPDTLELNISEVEFAKLYAYRFSNKKIDSDDYIENELKKVWEKAGIDSTKAKKYYSVWFEEFFNKDVNGFHTFRFEANSQYLKSKKIKLVYNNTKNYNKADEKYVKNLKIENRRFVEKRLHDNNNPLETELGEFYTNLINDSTIQIIYSARVMGFTEITGDTVEAIIGIFKNGVLYDLREVGSQIVANSVTVPNSIKDNQLTDYVINEIIKEYPFYNEFKDFKIVPGFDFDDVKVNDYPNGYTIYSKNSDGYTYSDLIVIKRENLATPTLKATVNANGTFTLSWNKVSGATRYGIYMLDTNGKYKWIKSTSATSWTTGVAQYGKKYTYKVFAVNDNTSAKSAFSRAVSATNNKKLQSTTAKVAVNANGSFKISWNKVIGAIKYGIYMKQANGTYKWLKTVTGTSWTTGTAQYGKQYSYKVLVANNNKSAQTFSNVVNAKNTKKLTTPSLKVAVNQNGSFKLSWNAVTGATSYQIYWKQANGSYKLMKTVSGTSYTTVVAAKGKTYTYKVRAVTKNNKNATSNYSNVVNAKRK